MTTRLSLSRIREFTTKTRSHKGDWAIAMATYQPLSAEIESMAREVVDAAYKIHRALGPGLLESVYETCLKYELRKRELRVETQVPVPIVYDGVHLDADLRLDLLVGGSLIVEVKSVEKLIPIFDAQLLTYLKLTNHRLGLLINFDAILIKDGIKRIIL
jgi:GxxExxY protein